MASHATSRRTAGFRVGLLPAGMAVVAMLAVAGARAAHDDPMVTATVPVPAGARLLAVNEATHAVYATNTATNSVSVIDGETLTVEATIAVPAPDFPAVNPDTNRIYVSSRAANSLTVIDGETNAVVAVVPVGTFPTGVSVNPRTNLVYVANRTSGTVSVVDGETNTVVATIPLGGQPVGVWANPKTNLVYVTENAANAVAVIDGETNTVVATIPVGAQPQAIWGVFNLERLYVSNRGSLSLSVVDAKEGAVIAELPLGSVPFGVWANPKHKRVYVALNPGNSVTVIDAKHLDTVASVPVGSAPMGVAGDSILDRVYVANSADNTVSVISTEPAAGPKFSDWAAPLNLGPPVNSEFAENGPALTRDGLSLFFASDRPGGAGNLDIWVSRRASIGDPWGEPVNVASVNSPGIENVPVLSRDERLLFFNSNRPGGLGDIDLWVAHRAKRTDDLAWEPPVNLGATVNSASFDGAPGLLETGGRTLLYFASGRPPGARDRLDIYVSEQGPDGSFGEPAFVTELNTPFNEARLSVRKDGREAFFFSNRPGSAGLDLWASTRQKSVDPWSTPTNLGPEINTAFAEIQPHIAPDRVTLVFASDRPGGLGRADLYLSTRTELDDG